jgi:hypothetical protein
MAYLTKAAKAGAIYAVELVYHPPENLKLRLFLRRIECVPTAMTKAASFPENELGAVTWVSYVEDQPCRCAEYAVGEWHWVYLSNNSDPARFAGFGAIGGHHRPEQFFTR